MSKQKRFIFCALVCLLLGAQMFHGCGFITEKEKIFTKTGMTIALTEAFTEKEHAALTAYYESQKLIVTVLKEDFTALRSVGLSSDLTLAEYAGLVIAANSIDSEAQEQDGLMFFTYDREAAGEFYTYFASVYKGSDAFWLVRFSCESNDYDALKEQIVKFAHTVKVD